MPLILPSLFDRLIDDTPGNEWEIVRMLEDKVKLDLEILMNSKSLSNLHQHLLSNLSERGLKHLDAVDIIGLTEKLETVYPEVATSVINFGMQDYAGLLRNEFNIREVIKMIEQAIYTFEPRILPGSLEVRPDCELDVMDKRFDDLPTELKNSFFEKGAFEFVIKGTICATPIPIDFRYSTELSLSTGRVTVR